MIPKRYVNGHRKAWALIFIGAYHIGFSGLALLETGPYDANRAVLYEMLPLAWRVAAWGVIGIACISLAPTRFERIGWAAAMIMPLERLISHAWSWAMYLVPGAPDGLSASGFSVLRWLFFAALIRLIASWPEDGARANHEDGNRAT